MEGVGLPQWWRAMYSEKEGGSMVNCFDQTDTVVEIIEQKVEKENGIKITKLRYVVLLNQAMIGSWART